MRDFINIIESETCVPLLELIKKAQEKFGAQNLYSGNCGSFAIALGAILSEMNIDFKVGILFNQDRMEEGDAFSTQAIIEAETDIYHMAIVIGNRLYDGDGEISEQDFVDYAKAYADDNPGAYLVDYSDRWLKSLVENETNWTIPPSVFEKAMRG